MYYEFLSYILAQLKTYNNLPDEKVIPMNGIIETVSDWCIRPAITYRSKYRLVQSKTQRRFYNYLTNI